MLNWYVFQQISTKTIHKHISEFESLPLRCKAAAITICSGFFYLYIPHIAVSETPVQRSFNIESILKER